MRAGEVILQGRGGEQSFLSSTLAGTEGNLDTCPLAGTGGRLSELVMSEVRWSGLEKTSSRADGGGGVIWRRY